MTSVSVQARQITTLFPAKYSLSSVRSLLQGSPPIAGLHSRVQVFERKNEVLVEVHLLLFGPLKDIKVDILKVGLYDAQSYSSLISYFRISLHNLEALEFNYLSFDTSREKI